MRITRFEFTQLHDFRPKTDAFSFEEVLEEIQEEKIELPLAPTFTEAQLEEARIKARKEGYNEGFEEASQGQTQTLIEREQSVKLALEQLAGQLTAQSQIYPEIIAAQSKQVQQFVMTIARKVTGEMLAQRPTLAINELIGQCLPIIVQKPKLTLEANASLIEQLKERLGEQLEGAGFEGEVQFRTNNNLGQSDARLEWSGGFAERNTDAVWKEIEQMIAHVQFFDSGTDNNA